MKKIKLNNRKDQIKLIRGRRMPAKNEFQCLLSMPDLGKYVGKWIAIVGGEVVSTGSDAKNVFEEAKKKYPQKEPLILKVPKDTVMLL